MVENNNISKEVLVGALSYILIGIIWYFIDDEVRKSSFVKFHVKQALNLAILGFVVSFILMIFSSIFLFAQFSFFFIMPILLVIFIIIKLFFLILWFYGLYFVFNKKTKDLPIIGKFAEKYLTF